MVSRILVPILLSVLTLSVFAQLRDYGPESTLRRFHEAIRDQDLETLDRLTVEGANDYRLIALARSFKRAFDLGVSAQILGIRREPDRVVAEVAYVRPGSARYEPFNWVLVKSGGRWLVNTNESGRIF